MAACVDHGLPVLTTGTPGGSSFRNDGALGTACFVTGTFGFVAASRVVEMIVDNGATSTASRMPPNRGGG